MNVEEAISFSKFGMYLIYFMLSLGLFVTFFKTYVHFTPYNELELIKKGNVAVAWVLAGTLLGYAINLGFALFYSYGIIHFLVYGIFSAILQIVTYICMQKVFVNLQQELRQNNNVAVGLLFGSIALCVGILNGASAYIN